MLRDVASQYPNNIAMEFYENGKIRQVLYRELIDIVRAYTGAVASLGLAKGDRIVIQSENCVEWAWFDWGCRSLGIIVVPIYPTLPPDQSQYILKNSGATIVVAGDEDQAAKTRDVEGVRIVLLGDLVKMVDDKVNISLAEEWDKTIQAVKPEDVATIIYTSGTTGDPKGAMLSHANFTDLCEATGKYWPISSTDKFLAFLPMSHVYERVAGQTLPLAIGGCIAYAQSLRSLGNDIITFQPTIFLAVPRVLEAIRDKILDGVSKQSKLNQYLFNLTIEQGKRKMRGESAPLHGLLVKIVGKKVKERLGGRIRFLVSGGAAMPKAVAEFYLPLGITILQGYGLTETSAITSVNLPEDNRYHTIGKLIPGVEGKIAEDGELLLRGISRMIGYYNLPKETAEAIDEEGWFHTGDIAEWDGEFIKIVDRKKEIIVLGNGKNVAPQMIENRLRESALIADAVVIGDGMEHISALVVPNFEALRRYAKEHGGSSLSDQELVDSEPVRSLIKAEITKINGTLADFEKVKKHALLDHAFSIEAGELTPSLKVKRRVINQKYKDLIAWLTGAV